MTNGIVYFNAGTKCLPRLLVSVYSLRTVYFDDISIISMGNESHGICEKIGDLFNCNIIKLERDLQYKHYYWLEKARVHQNSPYDNTIFLDSDTLIQKNFNCLFSEIEKNDFIVPQFSNWSVKTGIIKKRLNKWISIDEELVTKTLNSNMPSINVGVFGFNKKSDLMKNWFDFTINIPDAVLPEESTCHLLLNKYKGKIVDSVYNYSCKKESKPIEDAVIIHYHGRKHCRIKNDEFLYHGNLWMNKWKVCYENNLCDIQTWIEGCGDRKLKKIL